MSPDTFAIKRLRGSGSNYIQTIFFFCVALVVSVQGITSSSWDVHLKNFMLLSLGFMVSSIFTAAKTVRDGIFADLFADNKLISVIRGTTSYRVLTIAAALLSICFPINTILSNKTEAHFDFAGSMSFMFLGLFFTMSATLNLSKVVRDRSDAAFFESSDLQGENNLTEKITSIAQGSTIFVLSNGLSAVGSLVFFLSGLWSFPDLVSERKFAISVCVAFSIFTSMELSKFVRDMMNERLAKEISFSYKIILPLFFILSMALMFGSTHYMKKTGALSDDQYNFAMIGESYIVASVLSLSKLLRDISEGRAEKND